MITVSASLKVAGAVYLAWLAVKALRPGGVSVFQPAELPPDPARRPGWLRLQRYAMGTVFGALAFRLATDRARPLAAD